MTDPQRPIEPTHGRLRAALDYATGTRTIVRTDDLAVLLSERDALAADSPLKYKRHEDCPDAPKRHSDPPRDMNTNGCSPTKAQVRCPTCGFWSMWVPKVRAVSKP